jgi:hypothetical protein
MEAEVFEASHDWAWAAAVALLVLEASPPPL